jgi:hypothetical protein
MKTAFPKFLLLASLTITFNHCAILEFHNSNKGTDRILATRESECKNVNEFRHWSILYGTIPIRFLNKNPEDFLEGKRFRFKEKANLLDFIISILGGFSTSITTRTIVVENCEEVKIEKPQPENKPEEKTNPEVNTNEAPTPNI